MPASEEKIQCPKCEWEPDADSRWHCTCGTLWNTFDTYGQCPGCKKIWKDTQCPACDGWSKHADWYVDLTDITIEVEQVQQAEN